MVIIGMMKCGIGISPDSIIYFSCSENLINGNGFLKFDGTPYVEYAPLLPVLLVITKIIGINPSASMMIINAAIMGFLILFIGYLFSKQIKNNLVLLIGGLLILFSRPLYQVSSFAWTEPLFILFSILGLYYLQKFIINRKNKEFIFLILFTSLACLTRYIGVVLIITGFITILFHLINVNFKKRILYSISFGFFSSLPTIVFIIRNYNLTQTLLGERHASIYSLQENLYFTLSEITNWFLPISLLSSIWELMIILTSLIFVIITIILLINIKKIIDKKTYIIPTLYFFMIYLLFINISASIVGFDRLNFRLLSPLFIPIIIIFITVVDHLFSMIDNVKNHRTSNFLSKLFLLIKKPHRFKLFLYLIMILILVSSFALTSSSFISNIHNGIGIYSSPMWKNSELLEVFVDSDFNKSIYSNAPDAIYYFTNIKDVRFAPRKTFQASYELTDDLIQFNISIINNEKIYLAWFKNVNRSYMYSIEELNNLYNIESYIKKIDGDIYTVKMKN
jgi:hypothetical protein